MKHLYPLGEDLIRQASAFEEFANGGAQCHAQLSDGTLYSGLLISNSSAIVAMRGHKTLPFKIEAVSKLFQADEDRNPVDRSDWHFFDDWTN